MSTPTNRDCCALCSSPAYKLKALMWPPKSGRVIGILFLCEECVAPFQEELRSYAGIVKAAMDALREVEGEE